MRWESIRELSDQAFRRLTGVQKKTFEKMLGVLEEAERRKTLRGGRPSKLSLEDRLLMTLEYWREYRTYFHLGKSYGVSESSTYKIIRWIEDTLIQSRVFSLPGRKALLQAEAGTVALVDVTETPIQRPQKNRSASIQEKRSGIRSKLKWSSTKPVSE